MANPSTVITDLSRLRTRFKSIPVVGERLERATRESRQICELVQEIIEHREQYEDLALRVVQLLSAVAVTFEKLGSRPSQAETEDNVDYLRLVIFDVSSIVKDRVSHQHERRRALDILFQYDFNPLCRLYYDNADISRLHRRVDEVVEKFRVAPLMRTEAALALASFNIARIAQTLQLDGEKQHDDANSRVFNARKTLRAAVLAIIAIEKMSGLLDNRPWLSQAKAFEHEHSPDASHAADQPLPAAEVLRGRDISLPAHGCALSNDLIQHLENLIGEGIAAQTALDILDLALLNANSSHPAYGQGVRRLRRWCRKFALLPTSFKPINIRTIQLESEQPRYTTLVSDVFHGAHKGTKVAVKVLRIYTPQHSLDDNQKSFRNEVVTWRYLRHRNIVPFLGVCDKSALCLVSDWMVEGTLLEFLHRHPREPRTSYVLGTIRGLAFMHSLGVVHGDIKAMNVLVDHDHSARLADFGLASALNNATTAMTNVLGGGREGTARYMAPELFDASSVRTDRSDVYALSLTIWETFTLELPFEFPKNQDTLVLVMRVLKGERPTKPIDCENIGFTEELWGMMQRGWASQLESRPSLSEFVELLEVQG